jgi:hypothetical protein
LVRIDGWWRAIGGATFSYVLALAMSGAAVVLSVVLPPAQRGDLVATTAGATIGAAVGGLSLETFLLAQGRAWLERTVGWSSLVLFGSTVPLSALLGWVFTKYTEAGSAGLAALGAALLAAGTVPAAAGLTGDGLVPVYRTRAVFAAAVPIVYGGLALSSVRTFDAWLASWLAAQGVLAVVMWVRFGGVFAAGLHRHSPIGAISIRRMFVTHLGGVALIPALRFDQLDLARYGGAAELALYSLAIAASEFAQAGSVVAAQRVLGDRGDASGTGVRRMLRNSVLLALGVSVLILAGLYVIGRLAAEYRTALLLGLLLLPRSIFIVVGRILSARLVNRDGEALSAAVSIGTSTVAGVAAVVVVPQLGAPGAALLAGAVFALQAAATLIALRQRRGSHAADPRPIDGSRPSLHDEVRGVA